MYRHSFHPYDPPSTILVKNAITLMKKVVTLMKNAIILFVYCAACQAATAK